MNSALPLLFFATVALILGATIFMSWRKSKQRAADLRSLAEMLGFNYTGNDFSRAVQVNAALFRRGSGRRFRNVMNGTYGSYQVGVFDYSYTVSSGKNSSTYTQTVVAFLQGGKFAVVRAPPTGILGSHCGSFRSPGH